MAAVCERVYTDPADVACIEARVHELAKDARVRVTRRDGSAVTGVVAERPNVQTFVDATGTEGANAVVRLEGADSGSLWVWLDEIERVERLDPLV